MTTLTVGRLLATDVRVFHAAAATWEALANDLDRATEEYLRSTLDLGNTWADGSAARAAGARAGQLRSELGNAYNPARRTGETLRMHADAVTGLQRLAWQIIESAERSGYHVDAVTGEITAIAGQHDGRDPGAVARASQSIADEVRQLLERARTLDDCTVYLINADRPDAVSGFGSLPRPALSRADLACQSDRAPAEVHAWWRTLTPEQRERAIREHPDLVGWLDGVPASDRDRANRILLDRYRHDLRRRQDEIDQQLRYLLDHRGHTGPERAAAWSAIERLRHETETLDAERQGLDEIQACLGRLGDQGYLLGLSVSDRGRAIVSFGNPDTADNTATYVPGSGARLGNIGDILVRAQRIADDAGSARRDERTSVVLWLGYEAPQSLPLEAPFDRYAAEAAPALRRFQDGLRASHDPATDAHQTVLGYSYGTTVIGHAARGGTLDADDVILVASPGVDAAHASALGLRGGDHSGAHVWATRAANDVVQYSPVHGPEPVSPAFGAKVFTSDPGTPIVREWAAAHGEYWDDGNVARTNMANIIVGEDAAVRRQPPASACPSCPPGVDRAPEPPPRLVPSGPPVPVSPTPAPQPGARPRVP